MSVEKRPYAGSFKSSKKASVRYTPDALVFLNGDTSLNSTVFARRKIDIQPFITQVSCDHGTQPGTASASVTLSIPRKLGSEIFREGNTMLTVGLEVHIYLRGYHPVTGVHAIDYARPDYEDILKTLPEYDESKVDKHKGALAVRPYYHCFHGVVTQTSHEYSGGFYSAGLECTGMLHFWQYMDMSTNASLFGPRPTGSGLKMSLVGHNYTNKTPFSIIYSLYRNTAGAAGAVAFALSSSGNIQNPSPQSDVSLFTQTQRYWQRRFSQGMYRLRMYGVDGEMFNTATQAMLGTMTSSQLTDAASNDLYEYRSVPDDARDPMRFFNGQMNRQTSQNLADQDISELIGGRRLSDAVIETGNLVYQSVASETSSISIAVQQLKAYVTDISAYGSVNLFQSSYESKLDIAIAAANACGYEFYQDVDGDLVFKPPLYNMDTSQLNGFRIRPIDVISISYAENEPEATFMTVKSEAFQNTNGLSLSNEWGVRGQFIDYQLVAKYGWRPGDFEASFYSSGRAAFWAAVARMALVNKSMHTCSLTIPMRPELRCGYPVYIEHIDTYYYIDSMSHSFSYGGACQTTLQLVARRCKFIPPGRAESGKHGIQSVTLGLPAQEPLPLKTVPPAVDDPVLKPQDVRSTGFPNVVLALDPSNVNPMSFVLGTSALDITNKLQINSVLISMFNLGVIEITPGPDIDLSQPSTWGRIGFKKGAVEEIVNGNRQSGNPVHYTNDLAYANVDDFYTQTELLQERLSNLNVKLRRYYTHGSPGGGQTFAQLQAEVLAHENTLLTEWQARRQGRTPAGHLNDSVGDLTILDLKRIVVETLKTKSQAGKGIFGDPDSLSSAEILTLLGDRKASFSNGETPGFYRYYSSSHPDPNEHAPLAYKYQPYTTAAPNTTIAPTEDASQSTTVNAEWLDRVVFRESIDGFDFSKITTDPEQLDRFKQTLLIPEKPMHNKPARGFRLMAPRGQAAVPIMPSHRIHRLEFAESPLSWNHLVPNRRVQYPMMLGSYNTQVPAFADRLNQIFLDARPSDTLKDLLAPLQDQLAAIILPTVEPYPGGTKGSTTIGPVNVNVNDVGFFGRRFTDGLQAPWTRSKTTPRMAQLGLNKRGWADVQSDGVAFSNSIPEITPWGETLFATPNSTTTEWKGSESSIIYYVDNMDQEIHVLTHHALGATYGQGQLKMDRVFPPEFTLSEDQVFNNLVTGPNGGEYVEASEELLSASCFGGDAAAWYTSAYPWLQEAFENGASIGHVPLNCLPLVCQAFEDCYPGRIPDTVIGYSPSRVNMNRIYEVLKRKLSEDFYMRCWTIAGQYRLAFEQYIPEPVGRGANRLDPRSSPQARVAFEKYKEMWEQINTVAGTSWAFATRYRGRSASYYVNSRGSTKQTYIKSPIFPVSDAKGYEHYGCYAYGRGVDPTDGDFLGLMDNDPIQLLSSMKVDGVSVVDAVEQLAGALVSRSTSREARTYALAKIAKAMVTSDQQEELRSFLAHDSVSGEKMIRDDIEWNKFLALDSAGGPVRQVNPVAGQAGGGDPIEVDSRTQVVMLGLLNAFAAPTVSQSPTNTAYSLADLTPLNAVGDPSASVYFVASDSVLSDSFVHMDAYDASNFAYVASGGGGEATHWSPLVDHVVNIMQERAIDWAMHQQTLRGRTEVPFQVPELGNLYDKFVEPYKNLGEKEYWADLVDPITNEDDGLWAQVETIYKDAKDNLENSALGGGIGAAAGAALVGGLTGGVGLVAGALIGGAIGGAIEQQATDEEDEEA